MRKQTIALVTLLSSAALAAPVAPGQEQNGNQNQQQAKKPAPHVDLVIALDTSSSMDGLIDAAREKLWDAVSLLAQARPRPVLRVGLISYGNDGYSSATGWVVKDSDLTTDLDSVYSKLFALRTNGGQEYVARAVTKATDDMKWDQDPQSLKILFVAGNEPANQDPKIPVEKAVAAAREKGIFVNTIYCGSPSAGEARLWAEVANRGAGRYAAIDQNRAIAVATPMDGELDRLSRELNGTYVGYGAQGHAHAAMQAAQDKNAATKSSSAAASRAVAKSTALYKNEEWDLVDAQANGRKVAQMKPADLPPAVAAMPPAQREAFVAEKAQERKELQKKIQAVAARRDQYLRAERAKRPAKAGGAGFDDAMGDAIKGEATQKGLAF
jgi:hypothetical protein